MHDDNTETNGSQVPEVKVDPNKSSVPTAGYKKPPVATQFKKGQSGNKKGRPVGSQNFCTILEYILRESVRLPDGRSISKAQALVKRALYDSMKGTAGAITALDFFADQLGLMKPSETADGQKLGFLVVPRKLPREEWQKVALEALEHNLEPDPRFKPQQKPGKVTKSLSGEVTFHPPE
jgi:hypothetical protein